MRDRISPRQLTALGFVGLLSPLVRRFPRVLAAEAGRTAWLAPPLAAALLLGLWLLLRRLFRGQRDLGSALSETLGPGLGRVFTGLGGLWAALYAGALLRSGADRLITTVYQGAEPGLFVLSMALVCVLGAGSLRALGRSAMLLRPLLLGAPVLLFLLALRDIDFRLLLPVTAKDLAPSLGAGAELANLLAAGLLLGFAGENLDGPLRPRHWLGWAAALLGAAELMTLSCLGIFGPELTGKLSYPFFLLARDVTVLGALERCEPLVVALWLLSDFVFLSALLWIGGRCLGRCFPKVQGRPGRLLPGLCGVLAAAAGLLIPGDRESLSFVFDALVPHLSGAVCLGLPFLALGAGLLRKRI